MAETFYDAGTPGMPLYQAVQRHDRAKPGDGLEARNQQRGVLPPGWGNSLAPLQAHRGVDDPYALAWWLRRTGNHPPTHSDGSDKTFEAAIDRALIINRRTGLPKEYGAAGRGEIWAQSLLLDPTLPPLVMG